MSVSTPPLRRQRVLLIDNLDSFTWSLADSFRQAGARVHVRRDRLEAADLVVLSPGPGRPEDHALCMEAAHRTPLFGVCLGMQAIALRFGGRVVAAKEIVHGSARAVHHRGTGCFAGLPSPFRATRYHSLAVAELPPELEITAWADDGEVMGLRHRELPVEGVQFHPESVRTRWGGRLVGNVLSRLGR